MKKTFRIGDHVAWTHSPDGGRRFDTQHAVDSPAETWRPSMMLRLILPTRAGGAGSFLRSVRRRGVAGRGSGGKPSPPDMRLGGTSGGLPRGTNQSFSLAPSAGWQNPAKRRNPKKQIFTITMEPTIEVKVAFWICRKCLNFYQWIS